MGISTRVAERSRTSPTPRKTASTRRPASQLRWPSPHLTPKAGRVGAPARRAAKQRDVVANGTGAGTSRSMFGKVQDWLRQHPGHQHSPSQQALEAIAPTAYFRHR